MKKRIVLFDFYNLFIRNFQVISVTNEEGEHFGATFGFLRSLKSAIDLFKPTEVYVITDGPNASLRRKLMDNDYKANRKKEWKRGICKAFDFLNENEYKDNFNFQLQRVFQYLEVLPVKTITIPYVEADDVIAEIVNTVEDECVIYSTDADYKQLVSDRVMCYNPTAKHLTTKKDFIEKFGFLPENYIFYKMIIGDKSDGINGVNGIGPKTFIKLFPNAATDCIESTKDLLEYSEFIVGSKGKSVSDGIKSKHKLLIENEELLKKNWSLMQLQDVDVSLQTKDLVRALVAREPNTFNRMKLRTMFISDKLNSQVKYFGEWSRVFSSFFKSL